MYTFDNAPYEAAIRTCLAQLTTAFENGPPGSRQSRDDLQQGHVTRHIRAAANDEDVACAFLYVTALLTGIDVRQLSSAEWDLHWMGTIELATDNPETYARYQLVAPIAEIFDAIEPKADYCFVFNHNGNPLALQDIYTSFARIRQHAAMG
jgi:hypothetical protein